MKGVAYMPPLADSAEFAGEFARAAAKASEAGGDIADFDDADFDDAAYEDDDDADSDTGTVGKQDRALVAEADVSEAAASADEAVYDDPDWDAEESADAARLDGGNLEGAAGAVIADEFYATLDDSVVDEYPQEDIDA
jgi:hypothetical protein